MATGVTPLLHWARLNARIELSYLREVIAEFFGTFLLCLLAVGGTFQLSVLSEAFTYNPYGSCAAQGFAYFISILLFGGVSDGHLNPAVSIGMAIAGKISWIKIHAFIIAQFLGGYLGSLTAYGMYKPSLDQLRTDVTISLPKTPNSGIIWMNNAGLVDIGSGFFNEIVISIIFMMSYMAIKDMWNTRAPRYVQALLIGIVIIGLGFAFAATTGVMINPVRELAPRIAAISLGWSSDSVMKSNAKGQQWWAVGFFAPFIGCMLGSILYIFLIGAQIKDDSEETIGEVVAYGDGQGPENNQNQWRATVFIPKPHAAAVGRRMAPSPPMNGNTSPYRVQFQD